MDNDLLQPGPVRQVRFDLTSRCNLRCVYCAVSHPDYQGMDMSAMDADRVVDIIIRLSKHNRLDPIDMNGHGETTFRADWTSICFALIEHGLKIRLTSNFAKAFTDEELEALACMTSIAVSIDTADRQLLPILRRKVDLRQIVANIALVRATALKLHRTPPEFRFLCGLYDRNTIGWESFARLAIALDIRHVGLWSLTAHPGMVFPEGGKVVPLDDLDDEELRPRIQSIQRGIDLLRRHQVAADVQGDFVTKLAARVGYSAGPH